MKTITVNTLFIVTAGFLTAAMFCGFSFANEIPSEDLGFKP